MVSIALAKSRHLAYLQKPEWGGCKLCKHCGDMLNTEFTQGTHPGPAHTADQEQEGNFVWPKIVPGSRRCPLVRGPDKGDLVV